MLPIRTEPDRVHARPARWLAAVLACVVGLACAPARALDIFACEPHLAAIARVLNQRSVTANRVTARDAAFDLMWAYEARGLVDDSPGPRGGAGWRLSTKGATLIAKMHSASPDCAS